MLAMLAPGLVFAEQSLDLNLSGDAIRGEFSSDTGLLPNSNGKLSFVGLFSCLLYTYDAVDDLPFVCFSDRCIVTNSIY